jgi:hypothetical protein
LQPQDDLEHKLYGKAIATSCMEGKIKEKAGSDKMGECQDIFD